MCDRFKYRIYDLEQKHYLRVIQDETTGADGFAAFYGKYNNICKPMSFFLCHDIDRWVIEQCTGLKDKNGNLIYEGDIIHDLGEIEPICSLPLIVRWSDRTAGFYLDHQKIGMRASLGRIDSADSHNYEIIGNIHEQAEQKDK